MGLFGVFEDEPTKGKYVDETVGRFRSGHAVRNRPISLTEWRVTTGDPDVAEVISQEFGGTPQEWETEKADNLEIFTTTNSVDVVLDGAGAIRTGMVLFSARQTLLRSCDGRTQSGDNAGTPCVCPHALQERKDAAQAGTGCSPSIQITFALAQFPALGRFTFRTGSWQMARDIEAAERSLAAIDGPASATLALELIEWTDKKSNKTKSFTKPTLTNIKAIQGGAPF